MNKKFDFSLFLKTYLFVIIGILLGILILFVFVSYPYIYNFFIGEKVVETHILEVLGETTGIHETALALMNWHQENVKYPLIDNKKYLLLASNGFYEVDNKTRLFLRSNSASWVIKTKLARCGESAYYFVDIMNKLGYRARIVHTEPISWDHVWAEYYDENGNKIVIDPSANKVITNKREWVEGKNISKIIAKDMDGNKEDITLEYVGGI